MREQDAKADRLAAFSDAVIAVTITIMPFATSWIARTQMASAAVPPRTRRLAKYRSFATLSIFTSAIVVSVLVPRLGFALICTALLPYLTPQAPMQLPSSDVEEAP